MLIRLPDGYYFRRAVPSHIRDVIGKKELWLSLGTAKRETAKPYACAIFAETERLFRSVSLIKPELDENESLIRDNLPEDVHELFALVIENYHYEITLLKKQYDHQKLRHAVDNPGSGLIL